MNDNLVIKTKEPKLMNNVVSKSKLREICKETLADLKNILSMTYGPAGSNGFRITGQNPKDLNTEFTKDGKKTLSWVDYYRPIESAITAECKSITEYIEEKIGDGTTTAIILASLIFDKLDLLEKDEKLMPYQLMREFDKTVKLIQEKIRENKKDATPDDIYDIAMISTNGNISVSNDLRNFYKEYGMDVYIEVKASLDDKSYVREYNGISLDVGYSDQAYINSPGEGKSRIKNASIYVFKDPIDTPEMIGLFEKILLTNILQHKFLDDMIPTVIIAPKISRDMSGVIGHMVQSLYNYDSNQMQSQKPPILIITNAVSYINEISDIALLCGAKLIGKYINPEIQKMDEEKGLAANLENVCSFCGHAKMVESDAFHTSFYDPLLLYEEDGVTHTKTYESLVNFLTAELKEAIRIGSDVDTIGNIRRRLNYVTCSVVDYMVGGVSVSDRESIRDLVIDAVKNCRSASIYGVGYGACYEGLLASYNLMMSEENKTNSLKIIYESYKQIIEMLYKTVIEPDKCCDLLTKTLESKNGPINLTNLEWDGTVKCSIEEDYYILEAISKIITKLFTANQAFVQSASCNYYEQKNE